MSAWMKSGRWLFRCNGCGEDHPTEVTSAALSGSQVFDFCLSCQKRRKALLRIWQAKPREPDTDPMRVWKDDPPRRFEHGRGWVKPEPPKKRRGETAT